ncbi:MAG TPA: family 20 glycosylhydrolase [Candidatus Acidoferrales bacterium]|nr:family 20 glycosylhydrolase [Candidatus Acidoferrales bacterium]
MRRTNLFAFLLLMSPVPAAHAQGAAPPHHLMPVPASVRIEPGRLPIDKSFSVAATKHRDDRLLRGVRRALERLKARTGVAFSHEIKKDAAAAKFAIEVARAGEAVQSIAEDESYSLNVTPQRATLQAATVVGALRGLETFLQLVERDAAGSYLLLAEIADKPRFPWRGLLIDVCRHWQPVEVIKRNLDAMAAVKLNVLHWHLSEDQGFRVESRRVTKLAEFGSDGLYYRQEQIREVVAYARDRGIRVVPEFDMPGHSTAWFVGDPRLASAPGPYAIIREFGIFDATFDPTNEKTYKFLDRFVDEMKKLFPDTYWHIGGDEVKPAQWDTSTAVAEFKKRRGLKDNAALQAYFNQRLSKILSKHKKRMVGWDEILHNDLPRDTVVQSWRGQKSLGESVKQGFSGILSAGYYLDAMQPAAFHYAVDPLPATTDLDAAQASRVLGGEACMWGELITPENIDSRIWPRTAAMAERFWSPREVADVADMYRRLDTVSVQLEELGLTHLSGPDAMLRRLAGSAAIEPLRALLRLVEPLSLGQRQRARRANQLTPLTSPGDIAAPDAPMRREFTALAGSVLLDSSRDAGKRQALAREFQRWQELGASLALLAKTSPQLQDVEGVAADLADIGAAGQEALTFLAEGNTAPAEWTAAKLAALDRAATPKGLLRLAVVPALRQLVVTAGGSAISAK